MDDNPQTPSDALVGPSKNSSLDGQLSHELVREVAEKVYSMLLADLRIEQERCRFMSSYKERNLRRPR